MQFVELTQNYLYRIIGLVHRKQQSSYYMMSLTAQPIFSLLKIQLFNCTKYNFSLAQKHNFFLCSNFSIYFFHRLYLCMALSRCTVVYSFFCTSTVLQLYIFTVYNVLLVPNIIFNKLVEIQENAEALKWSNFGYRVCNLFLQLAY